jgi:hypothetical protein
MLRNLLVTVLVAVATPSAADSLLVEGNLFSASCPTSQSYFDNLSLLQTSLLKSDDYVRLIDPIHTRALRGFQFSAAQVDQDAGTIRYFFTKSSTSDSGKDCYISLSFVQGDCRKSPSTISSVEVAAAVCSKVQED